MNALFTITPYNFWSYFYESEEQHTLVCANNVSIFEGAKRLQTN